MNSPRPAIVSQNAVHRLPRGVLWLVCLVYVLPGFIGRAPWRRADMTAFGYMMELAAGRTEWLDPRLGGMALDVPGLLPYWLGALAIKLAPSWMDPAFAARIPFMLMLALALASVWFAVYYLARSPLAQPVAFAFGGEAKPVDYARALADGGLLAFIACLGLAQQSHETVPAAAQLCFVALSFYAYAALPYHRWSPLFAAFFGLTGLTLSGAPTLALLLAASGLLAHALDRTQAQELPGRHRHGLWRLAAVTVFIAMLASLLDLWRWQIRIPGDADALQSLSRLLLWFTWPAGLFVLWTLWRWRGQFLAWQPSRHLTLPLWWGLIITASALLTSGSDRTLLLALPVFAALAAFALPAMDRSVTALVDWFTLIFFSLCAVAIWLYWLAMQTGYPERMAAALPRLIPDFKPRFLILPFIFALAGTLAWGWLVKWRIGRHRSAIWKSMVLPAGGTALCWLLLTTLWLPPINHAQSYRPMVRRVEHVIRAAEQPTPCIAWFGLSRAQLAAFQYHGRHALEPMTDQTPCHWLIVDDGWADDLPPELIQPGQWQRAASVRHPRMRTGDDVMVLRRIAP